MSDSSMDSVWEEANSQRTMMDTTHEDVGQVNALSEHTIGSEQLPVAVKNHDDDEEEDINDDDEEDNDEELMDDDEADDMEDDFLNDDEEDIIIQQDENISTIEESNVVDDRSVLPTKYGSDLNTENNDNTSTQQEDEDTTILTTTNDDLIEENQNEDEPTLETTETTTNTTRNENTCTISSANQSSFSALISAFLKGKQNILAEKEESLAKNIYSTALNFHSKGDFNTAIDYYNRLLNREFIVNAVSERVDEESSYFDIKSNIFLYLKYLALKNLGSAFMSIKKFLEASICLAKALKIDASDASLWYDYAVASIMINDLSTARLALEQTLIINPNHHLATMHLLELIYIIGDVEECNILSKQVLKYDPHNKTAQFIHYESNPNPFNLMFLPKSPLNDLTRKWAMFACPDVEQESPKLYRITLQEADWTNILTRICSLYSNLLKQGQLDSIVKIVVERPSQIIDESEASPLTAEGESSQNGKRKRSFVAKMQTPSKSSKQMSGPAQDILNMVAFSEQSKKDTTYKNEKLEDSIITCDELPNNNLLLILKDVTVQPILEVMQLLIEKLTCDYWMYKWPEAVIKGVCFSAFSLMKHKIELSFECILCVAEILCGSYEKDTNTEINLSKARRLFSNLESKLLSSRHVLQITPTNIIRLLWVRGVIDQYMGNSPSSKKWLDQCLMHFQEISSQEILLPNCSKNNKINQDSINRKLNEMSFNKKVDLMSKLIAQHQYNQALSNISRDFLISLPSGARSTVRELMYKSLKHVDSLEIISKETLLHMLHFLLADITKQTIENINLKPFKALLPKLVKKVSSMEDVLPDIAGIIAMKVLIILEAEFLVAKKDESELLNMTYLLELFYYLAPFQNNTKRKEYLQFIRKRIILDMKKRIKSFLVFLLKEFHNLRKQLPEKSSDKNDLLREVSYSIYYLYGKFIPITDNDVAPKAAPFQSTQDAIEKDKDTCLLLYQAIKEFLESRLEKTNKLRKQIPEILVIIYNTINMLPEEAQSAQQEIRSIIDDKTIDLDKSITIPTVPLNDDVKDMYENCFYYLYLYKSKGISTDNIFEEDSEEYSDFVYLLRKAVCCKPMDLSYWEALAEKYWKVLQLMFAVADSPSHHDNFLFKKAIERGKIGLPEAVTSFKSDLESILFKYLHCLQVCLQLASKNEDLYSIHFKLGQVLFEMLDCPELPKEQVNEQMDGEVNGQLALLRLQSKSYFANHCFQYLESASKIDKRDLSQIYFLMARIREKFDAPSSEYLPLFISALKATPFKNPRMENIYFYYVLSLLKTLIADQNTTIDEKYLYTVEVDTLSITTTLDIKCPIINNLPINNPSVNLKIWTTLLSGVYDVLKLFPSSFRYGYLIAKMLESERGPWASKKAAEEVLSSIITKKENKQMPPTIEFNSKYEFAPTIEKRHQREWKATTLSFFLTILAYNRNIEYLLYIIYWLKHNLLERDKHLFSLYPEVLYCAGKTLISIHTEQPSQDLITYAIPIYCYILELTNKDQQQQQQQQLVNVQKAVKTLLEKYPKTKDIMSSKHAEKKLREFYEKEYLVDLVKFKKLEKKDVKESKPEKKKKKSKDKDKTEDKTKNKEHAKDHSKDEKKKEGKKKDTTEKKTSEKKEKSEKKKSEASKSSSTATTTATTSTTSDQLQFHMMETPKKKKKQDGSSTTTSSSSGSTNNSLIMSTPPSKSQSTNNNNTTPPGGKGFVFHHYQPQAQLPTTQKHTSPSSKKSSPASLKSLLETPFSTNIFFPSAQPQATRSVVASSSNTSGESRTFISIDDVSTSSSTVGSNNGGGGGSSGNMSESKSHLSQILSPVSFRKSNLQSSSNAQRKEETTTEEVIVVISDSDSD